MRDEFGKFRKDFKKLKSQGFVKSTRKGPTGIGHTLETYLSIQENNIKMPDLGFAELKAHRNHSNNLITLFTFNRKAWQMKPLDAVREYGSLDKNGRLGLYYTLKLSPNNAGLFVYVDDNQLAVRHIDGSIVVLWSLNDLAQHFQRKTPALILVNADVEERDGIEWFWFNRARLLSGTTPHLLHTQIKQGQILIDLRLHDKGTRARNHGTGFRALEKNLSNLFSEVKDIDV